MQERKPHALGRRIERILSGPKGAQVGAFFDFEGTIIDAALDLHLISEKGLARKPLAQRLLNRLGPGREAIGAAIHWQTRQLARRARGVDETGFAKRWEKYFIRHVAQTVFPEAWQLVQAHKRMGHTVVVVSPTVRPVIDPVAREFGIEHILATPMRQNDGVYTGELAEVPLSNERKAHAIVEYSAAHDIQLENSYAYANGDEDDSFLSVCAHPAAVNPSEGLSLMAQDLGWPVLHFEQRARVTLEHKLRTVASYTAMASAFGSGWAAAALGGSSSRARNFVTSVAPELGLALGGIELHVIGEENLWMARPAVFVFNHQSPLDLVIGVGLLRRNATGVVKKEVESMNGWGHFTRFLDCAHVDRADPEKAREALAPAVEKLRQGMSLGICPEGTRSYSPRLQAFKKGAFHLAMQAGVPMVPVVMRNVGDVMHRDAAWMRPGRVEVCVLPPVDTSQWKRTTLDQHVAEVRQMFIDTLDQWPAERVAAATRPIGQPA